MSDTELPEMELMPIDPPAMELAMQVRLRFSILPKIMDMPTGGNRSAVNLLGGEFVGPGIKGKAVPASGGDFAHFRPDGVVGLDARYMLQEEDGTPFMLTSRGYIWERKPGVMERFSKIARGLEAEMVLPDEYYFRTMTTFEVPTGKHDWMARHAFVGVGQRTKAGNMISYFKLS